MVPSLAVWTSCLSLAAVYAASYRPQKAVEFGLKALESLGFVIQGGNLPRDADKSLSVKKWGLMTDDVVGCWMIPLVLTKLWRLALRLRRSNMPESPIGSALVKTKASMKQMVSSRCDLMAYLPPPNEV
ncbi:hypothetical protein N7499_009402 [Penicillium canescens]|nr:hypothetical protein N7499_009402 [Penicillium canescens]KAJ6170067.1 hypothetical protein N7485_007413 [Penicillium canescens]